ncbi:hypothetical protein Y032_0146g2547 [Ancylostoma ceylanicum]|uniref:Uncharacterized protein n=1 Tax=Ancylostoma ceylanicum TaxID=53326 RepID=A0A016T2F4_9BILA|nr:hypothetical protein Y032_0146g2547 [Ancylostoma ceylanicum]
MNVPRKILSYPLTRTGRVCRAKIDEACFLNHNLSWLSETNLSNTYTHCFPENSSNPESRVGENVPGNVHEFQH